MAIEVHQTIDELMYEHRAAWAAAVVGEDAVDLAEADDVAAALADARAAIWLDGYVPEARSAVLAAAERGVRLVIAVPAHTPEGDELARAIDNATVVPQAPAAGSVIGSGRRVLVETEEPAAFEHAAWLLVCANVDPGDADARVGVMASGRLAAHVARLEEALAALSEANVRLARERLGQHDAAAGTIIGRIEQRAQTAEREAEEWKERFEHEQTLAFRHHEWFMAAKAKLEEPHHRAAERLAGVPGVKRALARLRRG